MTVQNSKLRICIYDDQDGLGRDSGLWELDAVPGRSLLITDGPPAIFTLRLLGQTLMNLGVSWLYFALMESSKCRASVGKLELHPS